MVICNTSSVIISSPSHLDILRNATVSAIKNSEDICIFTGVESSQKMMFRKNLLVMFSRTLRICLAEDPANNTIVLPDLSIKYLDKVHEILLKTIQQEDITLTEDYEMEKITETAEVLGIRMDDIGINQRCAKKQISNAEISQKKVEKMRDFSLKSPGGSPEHPLEIDISSDEEGSEEEDEGGKETETEIMMMENFDNFEFIETIGEKEDIVNDLEEKVEGNSNEEELIPSSSVEEENVNVDVVPINRTAIKKEVYGQSDKLDCFICKKTQKSSSSYREHLSTGHFFKEISRRYISSKGSEYVCELDGCTKNFTDKFRMARHIGSTHNKVQDVLSEQGHEVPAVLESKRRRSEKLDRSIKIKLDQDQRNEENNPVNGC